MCGTDYEEIFCVHVYVDDVPGIPGRAVVLRADRTSAVQIRVGYHRLRVDRRGLDPQPHRRRTDTGQLYLVRDWH